MHVALCVLPCPALHMRCAAMRGLAARLRTNPGRLCRRSLPGLALLAPLAGRQGPAAQVSSARKSGCVLEPRPRPKGHNAPKVAPRSERESGGPGNRDHCWACRQGSFKQALVEQRRTEILPTKTVGQRGPLAPEPEGVPLGSDWACWLAACLAGIGRCALFITLLCLPSSLPGPGRPQTERTIHGGCELPDASALP